MLDADRIAQEVTAFGQPGHDAVLGRFGPVVRGADGRLDRRALAGIVFGDPDRLAELEAIVHPAVRRRILAELDDAERHSRPVVVEAIKLVEGGLADLCDEVWLVTCDPGVQRKRVLERGTTAEDAGRRIAAQAGLIERARPRADRVIDSSGSMDQTRRLVVDAWTAALADPAPTTERPTATKLVARSAVRADRRGRGPGPDEVPGRRGQLVSLRTYEPRYRGQALFEHDETVSRSLVNELRK